MTGNVHFIASFSDSAIAEQIQTMDDQSVIELSQMPMEILEHILAHLDDDKHLLTASHVCKSFAAAAETAFARKYTDDWYCIEISYLADASKRSFHQIMLNKYGGKVRNILVDCGDERFG